MDAVAPGSSVPPVTTSVHSVMILVPRPLYERLRDQDHENRVISVREPGRSLPCARANWYYRDTSMTAPLVPAVMALRRNNATSVTRRFVNGHSHLAL